MKPLRRDGVTPGRDAVVAVDGLRFVMEGLKQAGGPLRLDLRKALDGIKEFDGVTGKLTWEQGRPVRRQFVVRGGKVVATVEPKE